MKNWIIIPAILMLTLVRLNSTAQRNEYILWTFETDDRIDCNPVVDESRIYFGSNDNQFYCIDAVTHEELWHYQTLYNVQSPPLIVGDILYFESGNCCFALDKVTGAEIWVHLSNDPDGVDQLDPWDYHHATPVSDDTIIYFGCGSGDLVGLDPENGSMKFLYRAIDSAAIRSTPVIEDEILYFGDWNGRVYAYDLVGGDTIWSVRTYDTQPYATFGMVNTSMVIHDSLLIFGARNPEIQVLNKYTGVPVWDYTVPGGGWISGDPLVSGDTLYIGGSDCHKLFAFNVNTGELFWDYSFLQNNFSRPLIFEEYIIFTTGNAYAYLETNYGQGYLYALHRDDGSIKNFSLIGGNIFTSPIIGGGEIYLSSEDKSFYSIDLSLFLDFNLNAEE
ncbi:PQQ-binding-like beta-propeller repeat protein [Bacteroidota bacterium]